MANVYKCDGPDCEEYTPVEGAQDHNWKVITDYFGDDGVDTLHYCSWDCVLASAREYVNGANTINSDWFQNAITNLHNSIQGLHSPTELREEEENATNQDNQSEDI